MNENKTDNQIPRPPRSRKRILFAGVVCLAVLIGIAAFALRPAEEGIRTGSYISGEEITEAEWKRIYSENGAHRTTHVYAFHSDYRRISFGVREYASGEMQSETFVGAVDWAGLKDAPEGSIALILKPRAGSLDIDVYDPEDEEGACSYSFSSSIYPLLEDMVLVEYRQLGESAVEDGQEILLLDYAWDRQGTYGHALSDEDLKDLRHYVEVYCTFEGGNEDASI